MPTRLFTIVFFAAVTICCADSAAAGYDPAARDIHFGGEAVGCSTGSRPGDCAIAFDQSGSDYADSGQSVLRTADGAYLVIGEAARAGTTSMFDIGIARLLRNGQRDPGFSDDGRVVASTPLANVGAAALDAEGRLLVAGIVPLVAGPGMNTGIVRFLPDGTRDMGFGDAGLVTVNCGTAYEFALDMKVDADNRILMSALYTGEGETGDSGLCLSTFDIDGNYLPSQSSSLPASAETEIGMGGIDVSGPVPRFAFSIACKASDCGFESMVGTRPWHPGAPISNPQTIFLDDHVPAGCTARGAAPIAVPVDLADGSLLLHYTTLRDDGSERRDPITVLVPPAGAPVVSCLRPDMPGILHVNHVMPTGDGSDDMYVLGNLYVVGGSNADRHLGVRRIHRGADNRYTADDSFDGGQPVAVRVLGTAGLPLFNDPSRTQQRALLDPGVPGDVPPLPQLVVTGTRQYALDPGMDSDFYVARLGVDTAVFADGFETP